MRTDADIRNFVVLSIDCYAYAEDGTGNFDIEGIVATLMNRYDIIGDDPYMHYNDIPSDEFWAIVADHDHTPDVNEMTRKQEERQSMDYEYSIKFRRVSTGAGGGWYYTGYRLDSVHAALEEISRLRGDDLNDNLGPDDGYQYKVVRRPVYVEWEDV